MEGCFGRTKGVGGGGYHPPHGAGNLSRGGEGKREGKREGAIFEGQHTPGISREPVTNRGRIAR